MAHDLSRLRKLFERGALKSACIVPTEKGWNLTMESESGQHLLICVARSPRPKLYKSLAAAVADAGRIGFGEVTLKVA